MHFSATSLPFIIQGIIVGFAVAAPVGPVNVWCINKTLREGWLSGFICGIGAALADIVYLVIVAFGLTTISGFLSQHQTLFRFLGLAYLSLIGLSILFSKKNQVLQSSEISGVSKAASDIGKTFLFTLSNPGLILSFTAFLAALGINFSGNDYFGSSIFTFGFFIGSLLWWSLLAFLVSFLKKILSPKTIEHFDKVAGLVIIVLAIIVFWLGK